MLNEVTARNDYTANGSTTVFAYTFRIVDQAHLEVLVDGTTKTLTTHYTVSGVGDSGGGNVTFLSAPANNAKVTIIRKQPISQPSDYVLSEGFPSDRVEKDLDKLAMIAQMFKETLGRALKFARQSLKVDIPVDDPVANQFLRWNAAADGVESAALPSGTATPLGGVPVATGTTNVEGTSNSASKSDHQHQTGSHDHTSASGHGGVLTNDEHDGYSEYAEIAAPSTPAANKARIFLDTADGIWKLKKDSGAVVNLESTSSTGMPGSIGQTSKNNAVTPNSQFDLDAEVVVLRSTTDAIAVRYNPGAALTNNILTAGPAANGRDQAGAFSSGSWVHFYWIWNGSALATLSSATAPPTGPTLPSGYTYWAYAGAVRLDGSSNLIKTRINGAWASYEVQQNVLTNGTATVETAITITSVVPPNALAFKANVNRTGSTVVTFRVVSGSDYYKETIGSNENAQIEFPNLSQTLYYLLNAATNGQYVDIAGYKLPNGGA